MKGKLFTGVLTRAHSTDAGLDVSSNEEVRIRAGSSELVKTALVIAVPEKHVGMLKSRSGLAVMCGIEVGAGIIDPGYRGEVKVLLYNHSSNDYLVKKGDRIAQLLTIPVNMCEYEQVESSAQELQTERGESGFGSSGY